MWQRSPRDADAGGVGAQTVSGRAGTSSPTDGIDAGGDAGGDAGAANGDDAPLAWLGGASVQRSATGPVDPEGAKGAIESKLAAAGSSSGAAPPAHLQQDFAAAGVDVSDVRVHTGSASASAAESVSARAFAVGQDVHFGAR
jgi:hypothetical protein